MAELSGMGLQACRFSNHSGVLFRSTWPLSTRIRGGSDSHLLERHEASDGISTNPDFTFTGRSSRPVHPRRTTRSSRVGRPEDPSRGMGVAGRVVQTTKYLPLVTQLRVNFRLYAGPLTTWQLSLGSHKIDGYLESVR